MCGLGAPRSAVSPSHGAAPRGGGPGREAGKHEGRRSASRRGDEVLHVAGKEPFWLLPGLPHSAGPWEEPRLMGRTPSHGDSRDPPSPELPQHPLHPEVRGAGRARAPTQRLRDTELLSHLRRGKSDRPQLEQRRTCRAGKSRSAVVCTKNTVTRK